MLVERAIAAAASGGGSISGDQSLRAGGIATRSKAQILERLAKFMFFLFFTRTKAQILERLANFMC
jgi:hypothetical protein